jgi:hypothetical protein
MRFSLATAAIISVLSISAAASAQTAPVQVKAGEVIRYSTGGMVGRVEYLDKAKDGSLQGVAVIYDNSRMVHIPASTLSAGQKGYVTSLSKAEVAKLN